MQTKLHQLVISALKRNPRTAYLNVAVAIVGYDVVVSGQVPNTRLADEVITTVEGVSPHLRVSSQLETRNQRPALAR
ncbi:MAG: hypothetical protein ACLFTK_01590 [Anaerolineales bacterium]